MTMPTHGCHNCANTHSSCGCTTAHAATTLTASAQPTNEPDIAVLYEQVLTAAGYDLPMDTPGPEAMTAGAGPNLTGPYATVPDKDIGKRVVTSVATGEVLYGLHGQDVLSPRSVVRGFIDTGLRGIGPTTMFRKISPFELVDDQIRSCDTVASLEREVADFLGPLIAAAAGMTPLGQQGRPVVPEPLPATYAQPTVDRFDLPELPQFDQVRSLYRDLGHQLVTADDGGAHAARIVTTLADQLRERAVAAGVLTAGAIGSAQGDHVPAFIGAAIGLRGQGRLATAADLLATLAAQVRREADAAQFAAIAAERDAELSADELHIRRLRHLATTASARVG